MNTNKISIITLFASLFLIISCNENEKITSQNKNLLRDGTLSIVYESLPILSYPQINTIYGDILEFDSFEHYYNVLNLLETRCDLWDSLVSLSYKDLNENEYKYLMDSLEYDPFFPLFEFEEDLQIFGTNLRSINNDAENEWLNNNCLGDCPIDLNIPNSIEQSLYNCYKEVCVNDTIYHFTNDGYTIAFSRDYLEKGEITLNLIRNSSGSEISSWNNKNIIINSHKGTCGETKLCRAGSVSINSTHKFIWTFDFGPYGIDGNNASLHMRNYEYRNGKWKKDWAIIALGYKMEYLDNRDNCASWDLNGKSLQTPYKRHHRWINYTFFDIYMIAGNSNQWHDSNYQYFRVKLGTGELKCRYNGYTHIINI